jgi:hypothetical protein
MNFTLAIAIPLPVTRLVWPVKGLDETNIMKPVVLYEIEADILVKFQPAP